MPTARSLIAGLAVALTAVSCTQDKSPTAPSTDNQTPITAAKPNAAKQPLVFPVDPVQSFTSDVAHGSITYTVANVQITHFAYEAGQLYVDGELFDQAGAVIGTFTHVAATLTSSGAPSSPTCQILN